MPTFVHRWQLEDGVTLRRDDHVTWLLELYKEDITRWPALVTTITGDAEPVSFGPGPSAEHPTLIHTEAYTVYYRATDPLDGPVTLPGVLSPDWYGRVHDALPPVRGTLARIVLVTEAHAAHPAEAGLRGPEVATVGMHLDPDILGVHVDVRLDPTH